MLSRRRIKATEQMWDEQVKKLERVALHADGVADTRAHEIHVLRRASYKKGAAVRNSRNVLSSSSGVYDPDTAESQREALRETMRACPRGPNACPQPHSLKDAPALPSALTPRLVCATWHSRLHPS